MIRGILPRRVVAVTVALVAMAGAGCANDAAPAATPAGATASEAPMAPVASDSASADPTPDEPTVTPVAGERIPAAHWVNSSSLLTHREAATGSGDTILPVAHAVADWLDAHLDDLQRGGTGLVRDVAAPGLLDAGEPSAITSDLASSDAPVAQARYLLEGSYDAMTEWLEATVEVTHPDGTVARATLVFTATEEPGDPVRLVLFGPADDAIPAPAALEGEADSAGGEG